MEERIQRLGPERLQQRLWGKTVYDLEDLLLHANYKYFDVFYTDLNDPVNYGKRNPNPIAETAPSTKTVTININATYNFGSLSDSVFMVDGKQATLTGDQYRTFVLLHELTHLAGLGTAPDSNNYNNAFTKTIIEDCIGVKFK